MRDINCTFFASTCQYHVTPQNCKAFEAGCALLIARHLIQAVIIGAVIVQPLTFSGSFRRGQSTRSVQDTLRITAGAEQWAQVVEN